MSISAQDVKNLREKTGAGMMDCKKALEEVRGDFEAAIDFLKKQGLAKAIKKGDRVAAEGLIFSKVQNDLALMLELNCETDFVGKNEDFHKLGNHLVDLILKNKPTSVDEALSLKVSGKTVQDLINEHIAIIGEKLSLRRFCLLQAKQGGRLSLYSHNNGRIAVLIEMVGSKVTDELAKDIAMQITAMSPQYLDKSQVPQDILNKEKTIQLDVLRQEGKPENMLEKIIGGKLDKFASEISLLQQVYVKDPSGKKKVDQYLKECDATAKVIQFQRFAVGEGIEKRVDDFAEEVKKMAQ